MDAEFELLSGQARLQLESRETGRPSHRHLPPERARGYALLTSPSQGDVFFDLEGDPYVGEKGIEYLWGYEVWDDAKSEWTYRAIWAHDEAEERRAFEQFVDMVVERRERYPDLHVFHYAPHEATKLHPIKGLAGYYGRGKRRSMTSSGSRFSPIYTELSVRHCR